MGPLRSGVALALLALAGCPSPGLVTGPAGIRSQQGYTLNTAAPCVRADVAVDVAERVLPLALRELAAAGYVADPAAALRAAPLNKVSVCLIEQPEPCSVAGWTAGPCEGRVCARKRGCATYVSTWAAVCWPPAKPCTWLGEPHCGAGPPSTAGWEYGLIHELFNLARARWARGPAAGENDYRKLPALFGPGGVESKVLEAYGERKLETGVTCP